MKAITMRRYGGPEVLEYSDVPPPRLGPDSVLVRVRAVGVHPVDTQLRAGLLDDRFTVRFPAVPGWDAAGVVEAVGPAVTGYRRGEEVMGHIRQDWVEYGTYAELVAAPERTLAEKPVTLDWAQAAVLPLPGLTAYQGLTEGLAVTAKECVVLRVADGQADRLAVQLAVARSARVIAVADPRHHARVRALGAEPLADGPGILRRVQAMTPCGVDAVYDLAGGPGARELRRVARHPRWFASAASPDDVPYSGRYVLARPDPTDLAALAALADAGALTVPVAEVLPLHAAAAAHELCASGRATGGIALTLD